MPFEGGAGDRNAGLMAEANAARLPILTFHALDGGAAPIAFPPALFDSFLDLVDEHGYHTIPVAEVATRLHDGAGFPTRSLALTFDDGFRSVFVEAYPRLRARGLHATLFLTAGRPARDGGRFPSLDGREMLSWDEVAELAQAGWEIGAHTVSHPDLGRMPVEQAIREMAESKQRIEERLGSAVTVFAYPFGRPNAGGAPWLAQQVRCACGVALGLVSSASDPFALERVDMYYLRGRGMLPLLFSRWLGPYLGLRHPPRVLRAWLGERLGR